MRNKLEYNALAQAIIPLIALAQRGDNSCEHDERTRPSRPVIGTEGSAMSDRYVIIEDETLRAGFTQIPNLILRRTDIQPGAKLTYMVLLSYAWDTNDCYPSQDLLAAAMGVSERSVITYLKQLVETKLITIIRRGLGLTNIYVIHRIPGSAKFSLPPGSEKSAPLEVQKTAVPEVQHFHLKNTQLKDPPEKDRSNHSKGRSHHAREETERISWTIRDISGEFADQAPAKSSTTRACNLYSQSGLELDAFLDVVQQARLRVKQYTGNIKTPRLENGAKPKMGYFFTVLEDLIKAESCVKKPRGRATS